MDTFVSTSNQIQYWYESFRPHFINMGLKMGYKKEELNDIISQFFLDLLEKNIDTGSIKDPQAYLSTAFRRKLVDQYRSSLKARVVAPGQMGEVNFEISVQETLERVQANTELINQIRAAYYKLPKRCQKVIYLKFYKGLNTGQIAEHTNLSKRTVYNNLFEGVSLLRKELQQQLPGFKFSTILSLAPLLLAETFF